MTAVMSRPVKVDVVRSGDRAALLGLFDRCSDATIVGRFFARLRTYPTAYLDGALAGCPRTHDAVVVRYGDGLHVAGLASVVAAPAQPWAAELGVLVQDDWQGRGLGRAMVARLLERAAGRDVEDLVVSVWPGRAGLLRALGRRLELTVLEPGLDCLTGRYRVPEEVSHGDEATRSA